MFKNFAIVCFFLCSGNLIAQTENPPYFPQEIILHPSCREAADPVQCLNDLVFQKVKPYAEEFCTERQKDTLNILIKLRVDPDGIQQKKYLFVSSNYRDFDDDFVPALKSRIHALDSFQVRNRKTEPWISKHIFNYSFVNQGDTLVQPIAVSRPYSGGSIEELPVFPGCGNASDKEACFRNKFRGHVSGNFNYPQEAKEMGLEGTVYVMFSITDSGEISRIRHRGPHPLLTDEAERIIKLLPTMEAPAKINGEGVRMPFSVPINFKLVDSYSEKKKRKRKSRE